MEAPIYYASTVSIAVTSNDFTLTFSRPQPAVVGKGNAAIQVGMAEPVAIVTLSPQSVKDLFLLLQDQVAAYEADWGKLGTDYVRRREAPPAAPAKAPERTVAAPTAVKRPRASRTITLPRKK